MSDCNKSLAEKANYIRKSVVDIAIKNGAGHIAPSLSSIDILTALYYNVINLPTNVKSSEWEERDRVIFSKAHGCYGLYAILSDKGIIPEEYWENFYKDSPLSGCLERNENFALEASCGALGHGLPIAVGIAFGAKVQNKNFKTYCIVGDGEMQEGSCWEAVQFAVKYELSNLILIIDNNRLQAMDFLDNVLTPKNIENDLHQKLSVFGFETESCNGHDIDCILESLNNWKNDAAPKVLVTNTVKGYGLKCMENIPKFHFRLPTKEELKMGKIYE